MDTNQYKVDLLNSKYGYRALLLEEKYNYEETLRYLTYKKELKELQTELVKLQTWTITNDEKVVIIFEGRDAAGKGGAIRRVTEYMNPRNYRIEALDKPNETERNQWYFQRYVNKLPVPGEIVLFDRSWYNRAIVEPVNGFCTPYEYSTFMQQVNQFEKMLTSSNIRIIKLYFSISKAEQAQRFKELKDNPLKKWKFSEVDARAQKLWAEYTDYKKKMFLKTDTKLSPWTIIKGNDKRKARIDSIRCILSKLPYQ